MRLINSTIPKIYLNRPKICERVIERFSILVPCVFTEGGVEGERELIGKEDNEKKCADKVRREKPRATGATWAKKDKGCYAGSGRSIKKDDLYRSCLFRGK